MEEPQEMLEVETLLDSCVVGEGKRWYQVKWKSAWVCKGKVSAALLEKYEKDKVDGIASRDDGFIYISKERKDKEGDVEYFLCCANTWEEEEKLNSINTEIVYSFWSLQSDLKDIVKIEEEAYLDYESQESSSGSLAEANADAPGAENQNISEKPYQNINKLYSKKTTPRASMVLDNYESSVSVKSEDGANDANIEEDSVKLTDADYQCARCNSLFISGKMLDFLSDSDSRKRYSKCKRCGEMFCPRCTLNMGELRHNGEKSLFCEKCIESFSKQNDVPTDSSRKLQNSRGNDLTNVSNIKRSIFCEKCGKTFSKDDNAEEHGFIASGESSFQCDECHKKNTLQSNMKSKASSDNSCQYFVPVVFQPVVMPQGNKAIKNLKKNGLSGIAGIPGLQYLSDANLKALLAQPIKECYSNSHSTTNKGDETVSSPMDGEIMIPNGDSVNQSEEGSIDNEVKPDGKEAPPGNYKCYDCGRSFNRQYTLDTHQRIHTGEKPYVCEVCGARFRQSGTKLNHVRAVHTKERPFQCQYCGKTFSHKSSITVHIRIHTNEKPYKCKTCERRFTDRATYLKHQSIHSGLKPYSCPMCTRKFSQKSNLKRHYRNIHEVSKAGVRAAHLDSENSIEVTSLSKLMELPDPESINHSVPLDIEVKEEPAESIETI